MKRVIIIIINVSLPTDCSFLFVSLPSFLYCLITNCSLNLPHIPSFLSPAHT